MKVTRSKLLALFLAITMVLILIPLTAFAAKLPCGHVDTEPGDHSEAHCGVPGHFDCDGKIHGLVCYGLGPGEKRPEDPPDPPDNTDVSVDIEEVNVNATWCLSGVDMCSFAVPGMPGSGKCVIYMILYKYGTSNPAGTYKGYINVWYTEMTPELMQQYSMTGDSYNEMEDNFFSIDILPSDDEWPFSTGDQHVTYDFFSITEVDIHAGAQTVHHSALDQPDVVLGYSISIDPQFGDGGAVLVNFSIGRIIKFTSGSFNIEYSPNGFVGDNNPNFSD